MVSTCVMASDADQRGDSVAISGDRVSSLKTQCSVSYCKN